MTKQEVSNYLQVLKELKGQYKFFDVHVHPYEIIFNLFTYSPDHLHEGLYGLGETPFRPPDITELGFSRMLQPPMQNQNLRPEFNLLTLRRIYSHTGPMLLGRQMELSGIDKVLLLPVAPSKNGGDKSWEAMVRMFNQDERFSFGLSIPNTVELYHINRFVDEKVNNYKITAIKLHPNITEINLGSEKGKERVEAILETCRKFKLPLIIHGGRSPILKNPYAKEFGLIKNFMEINWNLSHEVVVIAHAGGYGCNLTEMEQDVLPSLKKLLSRYANLMVDISGLEIDSLIVILKNIDLERIFFGSDALYAAQWVVLVKLALAIERERMNLEGTLVQIASINPSKYIFK